MIHTHILKTSRRTVTMTVDDDPAKKSVGFSFHFSALGPTDDLQQIEDFMMPILKKYDSDPREQVHKHLNTGAIAVIRGDANDSTYAMFIPAKKKDPQ